MFKSKIKFYLSSLLCAVLGTAFVGISNCSAAQLSFSPIRQNKILVPGSTDDVTVTLTNPADAKEAVEYELEIRPFRVDDNNQTILEAKEDYSRIVEWMELPKTSGSLEPNEHEEINITVTVPEDAPAGGQYAAVIIKTTDNKESDIKQVYEMTHLVFAEVAGETIHQGEISTLNVNSFILSGKITGSASVKNLGNIHSNVKHTLQVFPLIGSEELYTNEEEPQENIVMPGATRYSEISWEETPSVGIFRIVYTVEFEGIKNDINKVVIVCPIWLLAVIVALILVIIYKIVSGIFRKDKTSFKSTE